MPVVLVRPTETEYQTIAAYRKDKRAVLSLRMDLQLRSVLAWAKGKTFREVVKELDGDVSLGLVHKAVALYRTKGLSGFTPGTERSGRVPVPAIDEVAERIAEDLRLAWESGKEPSYRDLARRHGLSLGKVAKIMKAKKLDPKHRRGQVAPLIVPGGGDSPTPKDATI